MFVLQCKDVAKNKGYKGKNEVKNGKYDPW